MEPFALLSHSMQQATASDVYAIHAHDRCNTLLFLRAPQQVQLHLELDALQEAAVVSLVQPLVLLLALGIHHAAHHTAAGIEIALQQW